MNISKSSWHYKLNNCLRSGSDTMYDLRRGNHVSLCWYFWFTVGSVFQSILAGLFALFLTFGSLFAGWILVVNPLVSIFVLLTGYGYSLVDLQTYPTSLFLLLTFTTGLGILLYKTGDIKFAPEWLSKHFKRSPKPSKPIKQSLVAEYIKAKKQKICPLVKLEE